MTSGQEMNVEVEKRDQTVVASPVGEIDLARSPSLRTHLAEILAEKPTRLIIDLAQVPYMDSSGVATLVEALQQSRSKGCTLVLAGMQDRVRSVFEIARLDTVFAIAADTDTAMQDGS
jgi:anti-sigma B factor antagonist